MKLETIMNKLVALALILLVPSSAVVAQEAIDKMTAACVACHGSEGVSNNTDWPNLAGQKDEYLVNQLKAFKSGERINPLMPAALLSGFDDQQLIQMAKYYASLPAAKGAGGESPAGKNVRATCVACHGMTGNTVTSVWPNLAGQQAGYLKKTLMDYKSGARQHPIMQVIANELTDQQISDVADYYSQ